MINQGWIKLHRKIKDWEWYNNPTVFYVWHHLLVEANYEDKKWQGITIKRGQLVIGVESFGKKINMSRQQIRHSLSNLQNSGEITIKTTNKYTILTINNYNKYQEQPTNNQQSNQQTTTTKEYKEIKNIYASKNYLLEVPEKDLKELSQAVGVTERDVVLKGKDLWDWCETNGKTKKNYKAFLRVCLRKDHPTPTPPPGINFNSLPIKK